MPGSLHSDASSASSASSTESRPTGRKAGLSDPRWLTILLATGIAAVFVYRFSLHLFLSDDAFISFRYSKHWVEGLGLVWNPGEKVEGYTNFLWMALMAAGLWLGIEPEVFAPLLGLLSGLGVLFLSSKLSPPDSLWRWLTSILLLTNFSFVAWSSGGLETMMFSFWGLAAGVAAITGRHPALFGLCAAAATLTRPEGLLWAGLCALLLFGDWLRGQVQWRRAGWFPLAFVGPVTIHALWRYDYYGFWLPNTFYAKVGGVEWADGWTYFSYFLSEYRIELLLPFALLAVRQAVTDGLDSRWARSVLLSVGVTVIYGTYVISVGGDFLEFRFMVPWLPYYFFLVAVGVRQGWQWMAPERLGWPRQVAGLVLGVWAAVWIGAAWGESQAEQPRGFETVPAIGHYAQFRTEQGLMLRQWVDEGLLPEAFSVVTGGAGALPYYSRLYVLDRRGLNDVEVAHSDYVPGTGYVGHRRWASPALIRRRGVTAVILGHLIVYDRRVTTPQQQLEFGLSKTEQYSAGAEVPEDVLRLECRWMDENRYLLFGTNLAPDVFERQMGHLRRCWPGGVA